MSDGDVMDLVHAGRKLPFKARSSAARIGQLSRHFSRPFSEPKPAIRSCCMLVDRTSSGGKAAILE